MDTQTNSLSNAAKTDSDISIIFQIYVSGQH